jgi:hypothetical protein
LYWNNEKGLQLIEDADFREKVFQNINLSEVRRGSKLYMDCFKGAELMDMMLDHNLAKNEQEALQLGQEMLFQKHLTCLHIPREEECLESDFADSARRSWTSRMRAKFPAGLTVADRYKDKNFRRNFKKLIKTDPPFRDGQSLYKLNIKGEIMTEYLQQAEISEPIIQQQQMKERFDGMLEGVSFGVFGANNKFRRLCATLVCNQKFEYLVLLVIVLSRFVLTREQNNTHIILYVLDNNDSILLCFQFLLCSLLLALDEPGVDENSTAGRFFEVTNIIITVFFGLEMVIKMTAMTALSAENAYLTNGWNILDCLIVLLSVISLSLTSVNLDFVKALRSLRALRYVLKFVISICCLKVTISNQ